MLIYEFLCCFKNTLSTFVFHFDFERQSFGEFCLLRQMGGNLHVTAFFLSIVKSWWVFMGQNGNGSLGVMEDGFHCTIKFSRTMTCELDGRFREPNWNIIV
jgi:hypothetical protein